MDLPTPIQAFIDTTNRADTEAFVAAFTTDAPLEDWGRNFTAHDGIRTWNRTDNIGKNTRFELVDWRQTAADTYTVELQVAGDGYNGTGPMEFTLDGDRIARLIISDSVG